MIGHVVIDDHRSRTTRDEMSSGEADGEELRPCTRYLKPLASEDIYQNFFFFFFFFLEILVKF